MVGAGDGHPGARISVPLVLERRDRVEWMAMQLAMSRTKEEEEALKRALRQVPGFRVAVTEAGGTDREIAEKLHHGVVGAALNNGVVSKRPEELHALLHATLEAERGMLVDIPRGVSLALKVGIAARDEWLAVAMFGQSALHVVTNHWRAGLGVMHLNHR